MPTYEYACESCGHEFEREQRITEAAIKKCPKCKKQKARRMIGGGNFILKGGGWESDLYSGKSNRRGSSTNADTSTSSATGSSKSTKPDTKTSDSSTKSDTKSSGSSSSSSDD